MKNELDEIDIKTRTIQKWMINLTPAMRLTDCMNLGQKVKDDFLDEKFG